jgi:transposase
MAPGRYELSEAWWQRIRDTLPGRLKHVGRTEADQRLLVDAVLWVLRPGARWHDLPERYGKYKSVHVRFMRWARSGVWERIFADLVRDKKNFYRMLDSTIVRAHQQAAAGRKKGLRRPGSGAFPRKNEHQNPPVDGRKRPASCLYHHARASR